LEGSGTSLFGIQLSSASICQLISAAADAEEPS
jgi:hypothetical protein